MAPIAAVTRGILLLIVAAGCARRDDPGPQAAITTDPVPPAPAPSPAPLPTSSGEPAAIGSAPPPITPVAVTADGNRRLFSRERPMPDAGKPLRDYFVTDTGSAVEEIVLREDPAKSLDGAGDLPLIGLFNVGFDPDGARVLFSVQNGRGEAIGAVDLKTRKITWITDAFGYLHVVVPRGRYRGALLVYKHRYHPGGGSYDVCLLVDGKTGREIRDLTSVDPECGESDAIKKALGY